MNTPYKEKKVLSRDGKKVGRATGGTRLCTLEGCGGLRVCVRWSDGRHTWPCTKGMTEKKGALQIL